MPTLSIFSYTQNYIWKGEHLFLVYLSEFIKIINFYQLVQIDIFWWILASKNKIDLEIIPLNLEFRNSKWIREKCLFIFLVLIGENILVKGHQAINKLKLTNRL